MSERPGTWVYAIARDLDAAILGGVEGVGGQPARAVGDGWLTAVVSSVEPEVASEGALERRLSEPGELEAIARAHHHVVEAVTAACPVLPLRLATVYRDDDRVRGLLAERRPEFTERLHWLAGRAEWGVKVWAGPGLAAAGREAAGGIADRPACGGPGGRPGAGAAYLSRRRDQLAARADSRQRAAERGEEIHASLAALAVAARRHPPQATRPAGERELMILNGAYLICAGDDERFAASARAAADAAEGFRLEVTGPWPPYSFADCQD